MGNANFHLSSTKNAFTSCRYFQISRYYGRHILVCINRLEVTDSVTGYRINCHRIGIEYRPRTLYKHVKETLEQNFSHVFGIKCYFVKFMVYFTKNNYMYYIS